MLRMIDRHAVHALLKAGRPTKEIAQQFGVTPRTIQRIAKEPPIEEADDAEARRRRAVGRPAIPQEVRTRLRALIAEDPEAPPLEFLRQLREDGTELGESTFYRVFRLEKEKLPTELMVRFEGVAGEFAQFDFGQTDVRLLDGRRQRIHFAAYRLKFSRWVWVVIVPDERIESLVRALLLSFEHAGGVPLRVVFDNPKTVVLGRDEHGRPRWNQTLAQVAIDYGFTIELCAPRRPEQKGSVENLVGWVKRSFFRARRFADLEHDLPRQLLEWLVVVNEERVSRATRVIPAERLAAERERMKPLAVASGRVRPALPGAGRPHGAGRLPGHPLCDAGRSVRDSSHAPPLPGPGADQHRGWTLRGDAPALSDGRQDQLPGRPASRAARRRSPGPGSDSTSCGSGSSSWGPWAKGTSRN
jgi:transposase